jgi:AraC-like DNA-binding protein
MNIISLPDNLPLEKDSPIQVFEYRVDNNCSRSKINLTKNTISFLNEGTKEFISHNKSTTIKNDRFLVMKSGNCLMTETISPVNKQYKSILLFFSDKVLLDFLEKNKLNATPPKNAPSYYAFSYDSYIQHFVESLEKISQLEKQLQGKLLRSKFEEIMTYLTDKKGKAFLNGLLKNHDDKIMRLINVVDNNKLHKLTLQELSFLCNMSLSTFKREFSKQYQMPPSKWFQEKRLEHAEFLLRTQKKRPIEIYESAGYESLSNFIQAFKKKYGYTPKQFQLDR